MITFWSAAFTSAALLSVASFSGGASSAISVLSIIVLVVVLDRRPALQPRSVNPLDRICAIALGVSCPILLLTVIWAVGSGKTDAMGTLLLLAGACLWFGKFGHANLCILLSNNERIAHGLAILNASLLLNGHQVSAHRLAARIEACVDDDVAAPRLGEGYWNFVVRSTITGFRNTLAAETCRRKHKGQGIHKFAFYGLLTTEALLLAYHFGHMIGVAALVTIAVFVHLQTTLAQYVQRYALPRRIQSDGTLEPMGVRHTWSAPSIRLGIWASNAPDLSSSRPTLPQSYLVMSVFAIHPPAWRRIMDERASIWRLPHGANAHFSTSIPFALMMRRGMAGQTVNNLQTSGYDALSDFSVSDSVVGSAARRANERG